VTASLSAYYPGILITNQFGANGPATNAFKSSTNFYKLLKPVTFAWMPYGPPGYGYCEGYTNYIAGPETFLCQITYDRIQPIEVIGPPLAWGTNITRSSPAPSNINLTESSTAAICFNVGNVTKPMLDVHAQE